MTKDELIAKLREQADIGNHEGDLEMCHCAADDLLIEYIADPEIEAAYDSVPKWYAGRCSRRAPTERGAVAWRGR
jgi:hypothetical protein